MKWRRYVEGNEVSYITKPPDPSFIEYYSVDLRVRGVWDSWFHTSRTSIHLGSGACKESIAMCHQHAAVRALESI